MDAVGAIALSPSATLLLQLLLAALSAIGLYLVVTNSWPDLPAIPNPLDGWREIAVAAAVILLPLAGILWLGGVFSLPTLSTTQLLQLLLAALMPIGLYVVLSDIGPTTSDSANPVDGWLDILAGAASIVVPLVGILWLEGAFDWITVSTLSITQLSLAALIPIGLYVVLSDIWPTTSDRANPIDGAKDIIVAAAVIVVPLAGILWLEGFFTPTRAMQTAQLLLMSLTPVGLYIVFTTSMTDGVQDILLAAGSLVVPLVVVLWLGGYIPTVLAAFAEITIAQWLQLLFAMMLPIGLFLVVTGTRTVKWNDLLLAIGMFVVPSVAILQMQGNLPIEVTTAVMGFALGHAMEMLDED